MSAEKTELDGSSFANPLLLQLQQTLTSCSKSIVDGDLSQSQTSVSELVNFLDSVSDATVSEPENEVAKANALAILSEIYNFLCSPSLDQEIIDALSFELPKSVSKFSGVSPECLEIADRIIDRFIKTCSPRDMLSILCEALDSPNKTVKAAAYVSPLIGGLSEVFLATRRRHFEQIKVAVPVIVKVVKAISSESDYEDTELETLFDRVVKIAHCIRAVSTKLEDGVNEKLRALLGLYVLQISAVTMIIIYTSDTVLRKNAFEVLKRVLADIPDSQRFDILKALITNSDSSSMAAILLDLVRGEMHRESTLRTLIGENEVLKADNKACQNTLFWSTSILELIESVLRPVKGGPPILPENGDVEKPTTLECCTRIICRRPTMNGSYLFECL